MNWITGLFTSARDEVRFRMHERVARRAEIAEATLAFPTAHLQSELENARERLAAELEERFDAPMRANLADLVAARSRAAVLDSENATLIRDHPAELKAAYAELGQLKARMAVAKEAVDDAYVDLKSAKGRISSWHSRSKSSFPIYGKRGKPIPRHSFFAFSHSDLDSAKRDADRASNEIADAKRDRDMVFSESKSIPGSPSNSRGPSLGQARASA